MATRWILLAHAAVVIFTGAVVYMDRNGTFLIINEAGVNDYTMTGQIVFDVAAMLCFTCFLFPVLAGIALYKSQPPRRITFVLLTELLLEIAHVAVIVPFSQ